MKTRKIYWTLLIIAIAVFSGCKQGGKRGVLTPTSSALPYELLVVIDNSIKESSAGEALINVLTSNVPGLPQPESAFKLMYTDPQHFDGILKPIRNIVIVNIGKTYTEARFNTATDVYSFPQSILTVQAPSIESMKDYLDQNGMAIVDYFTKAEMNRQIRILEKNHSDAISNKVKEMFDCDVWVSGELASSKVGKDFLWTGTNEGTSDRYFVMYSIPYEDDKSFTREYFLHKRDSVMQENIPGAEEGMYMTTVPEYTDVKVINVQNEYTLEARGLWKIKNDMMGGPFISHMRLDQQNKKLIFAEIFVYAPEKMKRNLVRQMEASLYTLRLSAALTTDNNAETDIVKD
ncbi:DUF4837 family protein [Bacteroides sp.]|uniref:DUF4837 family protein n=1 Tax=Bacteroides sp. TaxID=29523 RepID=UPI002586C753|nr:DUF4837 family protein [Bacteroides sp.]